MTTRVGWRVPETHRSVRPACGGALQRGWSRGLWKFAAGATVARRGGGHVSRRSRFCPVLDGGADRSINLVFRVVPAARGAKSWRRGRHGTGRHAVTASCAKIGWWTCRVASPGRSKSRKGVSAHLPGAVWPHPASAAAIRLASLSRTPVGVS